MSNIIKFPINKVQVDYNKNPEQFWQKLRLIGEKIESCVDKDKSQELIKMLEAVEMKGFSQFIEVENSYIIDITIRQIDDEAQLLTEILDDDYDL